MDNIVDNKFVDQINADDKIPNEVKYYLVDRDRLLQRKPFTRGATITRPENSEDIPLGGTVKAQTSRVKKTTISQDDYIAELDPYMHDVLFDDNIPSICVKLENGGQQDIKFVKTAIPFQQSIKEKQTLHLSSMPMKFTLAEKKPTERQQADFVTFKHYWDLRNQDGMKVKMVDTAKSYGDAGLLYYMSRKGEIKSRLISYADGYVICSHNDDNGDRLLETLFYVSDNKEYIDSYDDTNIYRYSQNDEGEWSFSVQPHGFSEIPLITKRTTVAWDNSQPLIESYEILYNIFQVLQKRWGWGILYIKGKMVEKTQKIAGNIVLNDKSIDGKGDAKFLEPPSPQNMTDTLQNIFDRIQVACGTTFILPRDIHTSSDTSGISVKLTQSLDIQTARNGIVEWQNVADKMVRLFKDGLSRELVQKGVSPTAYTDFQNLNINASFEIWTPYSESEYNQMLCTMKNSGILSMTTAVEQNTISRPDEVERINKEAQKAMEQAQQIAQQTQAATEEEAPKTNE